jgi:hypothetical protein
MTAVAVETDFSVLFDWNPPCEKDHTGLCLPEAHDAELTLRTVCPGCAKPLLSLVCERFRIMLEMYLDGPGVECLVCKTRYSAEDFVWEPLR